MTKSYENWDIFPYDTRDLAAYMLARVTELRVEMTEEELSQMKRHKESLESTVKREDNEDFKIDERAESRTCKTPSGEKKTPLGPPIVFRRPPYGSLLKKRSGKIHEKNAKI